MLRTLKSVLVHPGEVEQVADEPLQPSRLGGDGRRRLARVDRAVLDRLRIAANRGERCLELVADREQEVPLRLLCLPELCGEVVERDGEGRDLGGSLDRHRLGMGTAREAPRSGGDTVDGPRDAPREQERRRGREHASNRRRDEEPPDIRRQQ